MLTLPRIPRSQTRYQPSWQARAIAEVIRQTPVDEVITYTAMKEAAGGADVTKKRYLIETARRLLEREGIAIDCVTRVGYKRLTELAIVEGCEGRRKRTSRLSQRNLNFVRCANLATLEPTAQNQALAYAALFVAVGVMSSRKTLNFVQQYGTLPEPKPITAAQVKGLFR